MSSTQNDDALTLARSAAYGGSRDEAESVSTKSDDRYTVKKSLTLVTGTSGHEYALYHVNQLYNTSIFARLVYDPRCSLLIASLFSLLIDFILALSRLYH